VGSFTSKPGVSKISVTQKGGQKTFFTDGIALEKKKTSGGRGTLQTSGRRKNVGEKKKGIKDLSDHLEASFDTGKRVRIVGGGAKTREFRGGYISRGKGKRFEIGGGKKKRKRNRWAHNFSATGKIAW